MKILTAIITYNRFGLLRRCINKVNEQSVKADKILVINNSSTDETEAYLINNSIEHITQKNNGSASGWHTAIEYAKKNNYEYLWLMDDDGYPDKNALKNLTLHFQKDKSFVCLSSTLVDEKNSNSLVFPLPLLNKSHMPKLLSFKRKFYRLDILKKDFKSNIYPYVQLFNGALILVDTLNKIGNINTKYFIFGEEVDMYWNIKKYGKVGSLLNTYHYHPDVGKRKYSDLKVYYFIKNSIINNYKHMDQIFIRNIFTIMIVIIRSYLRNGFSFTISLLLGKRYKLFYLAVYRGLKKKLEVDHDEFI